MDKKQYYSSLFDASTHNRLNAARYFFEMGEASDCDILLKALEDEPNSLVQEILKQTINKLLPASPQIFILSDQENKVAENETEAKALEQTTKMILHEIRPVIGRLKIYASEGSINPQIPVELDKLSSILNTFENLNKAATAPHIQTFDLALLIEDMIRIEFNQYSFVLTAGPSPFIVNSDPGLLELVLSNGLRNAIEATLATSGSAGKDVIINWAENSEGFWFAILDEGTGLLPAIQHALKAGTSTKERHLGYGLKIAIRAAKSLGGKLTLSSRPDKGSKFELIIGEER